MIKQKFDQLAQIYHGIKEILPQNAQEKYKKTYQAAKDGLARKNDDKKNIRNQR